MKQIKQTHPCKTPLLVDGFGIVKFGEEIKVNDALAKSLLASKHWKTAPSEKSKKA
jgi:hypothetical protein